MWGEWWGEVLGGTWMLSVGKGLARTWNWPVRESTRIVWLLLVKVRMYLAGGSRSSCWVEVSYLLLGQMSTSIMRPTTEG